MCGTVRRGFRVVGRVEGPQQRQLLRSGRKHTQLAERQNIPGRLAQQLCLGAVLPEILQSLQDCAPGALHANFVK